MAYQIKLEELISDLQEAGVDTDELNIIEVEE